VLTASTEKDIDSYSRLTPFDSNVRQLIAEIYEDLAINAIFDGILFHDDATLNENEDSSQWALDYYSKQWGLPESVSKIRNNQDTLSIWTNKKAEFLTKFSLDLAQIIRQYQPQVKTARNMYAEVVLNPDAKEWFAQSLPNFLESYDYTAVMSMPYMENAEYPIPWLKNLIKEIAKQPLGLEKTMFELQSVDWRIEKPVDSTDLADQMRLLQSNGALNFGYYSDDFLHDSPQLDIIRPAFSLQEFPFSRKVK
jgi:biofilm PGA synthesis lipoprotein PgaB